MAEKVDYRTGEIKEYTKGNAASDKCPRQGWVRLTKDGKSITMRTICKTWSCVACRNRVKARIKEKIKFGCSMGAPSWFITNTFAMASQDSVSADYVRKVWARYLRTMNQIYPNLQWFRVIELTKKKTPHLHTIMQGIGDESCGAPLPTYAWYRRECDCISHTAMRAWRKATNGVSYVGDVQKVVGASGAANYLAPYFTKANMQSGELWQLGFKRRWSTSRNWPRPPEERLLNQAWDDVKIIKYRSAELNDVMEAQVKRSEGSDLLERANHEYWLEKVEAIKINKVRKVVKKLEDFQRHGERGINLG